MHRSGFSKLDNLTNEKCIKSIKSKHFMCSSLPVLPKVTMSGADVVLHKGGCHCGAVRFQVSAPKVLHVFDCNVCVKKGNKHFIIPKSSFKLVKGEDNLTTYTFNTHKACHTFCKTCGVQSFYSPRSNPDGYGVAPHCLDPGTVDRIEVETVDGQNWEDFIQTSDIAKYSKT